MFHTGTRWWRGEGSGLRRSGEEGGQDLTAPPMAEKESDVDRRAILEGWQQMAAGQTVPRPDVAEVRLMLTLTFKGRVPGPQRGRKAVEGYFDNEDFQSAFVVEERGAENHRLHYHGIAVVEMFAWEDPIQRAVDLWQQGFAKIELLRDLGGLAYVTKYVTKTSEQNWFYVKTRREMAQQGIMV